MILYLVSYKAGLAIILMSLNHANQCRNYYVRCLKHVLLRRFQRCLENTKHVLHYLPVAGTNLLITQIYCELEKVNLYPIPCS